MSSSSPCLGRAAVPVKRVCARLGRRRRTTGLGRLRKEVRTCEYRDVHVMWEMLSSSARGGGGADTADHADDGTRRKAAAPWSRLASYCCGL